MVRRSRHAREVPMGTGVLSESENRFDVYCTITEKIIAALEEGTGPFVMPWHGRGKRLSRPANAATGSAYRGVNIVALWVEAAVKGYASNLWATYRQWQALNAQVRRGEHGAVIVFYMEIERLPPPRAAFRNFFRSPRL